MSRINPENQTEIIQINEILNIEKNITVIFNHGSLYCSITSGTGMTINIIDNKIIDQIKNKFLS